MHPVQYLLEGRHRKGWISVEEGRRSARCAQEIPVEKDGCVDAHSPPAAQSQYGLAHAQYQQERQQFRPGHLVSHAASKRWGRFIVRGARGSTSQEGSEAEAGKVSEIRDVAQQ